MNDKIDVGEGQKINREKPYKKIQAWDLRNKRHFKVIRGGDLIPL